MTSRGGKICFGSSVTSCEQRTLRFEGLLRPGLASCVYGKRWAKRFLENCAPRLPISSRSICRARSPKTSIVGVDLERAIDKRRTLCHSSAAPVSSLVFFATCTERFKVVI